VKNVATNGTAALLYARAHCHARVVDTLFMHLEVSAQETSAALLLETDLGDNALMERLQEYGADVETRTSDEDNPPVLITLAGTQ
jgi:hypothetical protein